MRRDGLSRKPRQRRDFEKRDGNLGHPGHKLRADRGLRYLLRKTSLLDLARLSGFDASVDVTDAR